MQIDDGQIDDFRGWTETGGFGMERPWPGWTRVLSPMTPQARAVCVGRSSAREPPFQVPCPASVAMAILNNWATACRYHMSTSAIVSLDWLIRGSP